MSYSLAENPGIFRMNSFYRKGMICFIGLIWDNFFKIVHFSHNVCNLHNK